jgi:hypothetical protein
MAEGVEGAVLFVPLITTKYTASPNCRRECSAAAGDYFCFCFCFCVVFDPHLIVSSFLLWHYVILKFNRQEKKDFATYVRESQYNWVAISVYFWAFVVFFKIIAFCVLMVFRTECFDNKISKDNLENFLNEVEKAIPEDSPARQLNLSIYISYAPKDRVFLMLYKLFNFIPYNCQQDSADIIRKLLEDKKPPFNCIMSAEEKSGGSVTTPRAGETGADLCYFIFLFMLIHPYVLLTIYRRQERWHAAKECCVGREINKCKSCYLDSI